MRRTVLTLLAIVVFALYIVTGQLSQGRPAAMLGTPLDARIPFLAPAEFIYFCVYLFLMLPVAHVRHPAVFERCAYAFYALNLVSIAIFWVFPVRIERPTFPIESLATWGVAFNYAYDPPYNCFPSLHVANAVFAALASHRVDRRVGAVALALAAAIAVSTLLVKQHFVADVLAGLAFGAFVYRWVIAPAVPDGASSEELAFPWWRPATLGALYLLVLALLGAAYEAGWQPFPWPLPDARRG